MNREEANKEAKKIYEEWCAKAEQIEKEAKEKGIWQKYGLDANNYLFKENNAEAKEKLKKLRELIEE